MVSLLLERRDAHPFLEGGEMVISFMQRGTGDDAPYSLEGGMLILPVKAGGEVLLHTEKGKEMMLSLEGGMLISRQKRR